MKLDKKQIPQLVALGLLVLACVGYASFTLMKPSAPAGQPGSGKDDPARKATVQVQSQVIPVGTFPDLTAPLPRRDPFVVQSLGIPPEPDPNQSSTKPTVRTTELLKPDFGKVPPLTLGNMGQGSTPKMTVVPAVEADPAFVLTGVIRGDQNVAIIRVGNSERHIVREGQVIDGRYRVLSVSEDGAVLACKDRRIHLRLGGVRNAS